MRAGLTWIAALALGGCSQSAADIVTGTHHCTDVALPPDLRMRLSSYSGYPDSIQLWVVQACHSSGAGCSPIMTYDHALPPIYALGKDGALTITILGGTRTKLLDDSFRPGDKVYPVRLNQILGNIGASGVAKFKAQIRHRCPSGSHSFAR